MSLSHCLRRQTSATAAMLSMIGCSSGVVYSAYHSSGRRASSVATVRNSDPVVYRRLRDCQNHVRGLIQGISGGPSSRSEAEASEEQIFSKCRGGARTLLELQELSERFVATLHSTVFLPRDLVREVDDFPMFLLRFFRHAIDARKDGDRPRSEEEIIEGFVDWMDMVILPSSSSNGGEDVISFVELMQLVQSFVRYHRGVRWGGGMTEAEWHRKGYLLHPWHNTYCPSLHAEQMPYAHLLQWLLRRKPSREDGGGGRVTPLEGIKSSSNDDPSRREDPMRWWDATESFSPPSWRVEGARENSVGFSALDCGCHSGYMTDLLLKAGAQSVVGVDVSSHALGSAEATLREHLRERRRNVAHVARMMRFIRCDLFPEPEVLARQDEEEESEKRKRGGRINILEEKGTMTSAAVRRRRLARHHRLSEDPEEDTSRPRASSTGGFTTRLENKASPFDLVVFHPPIKPLFPSWPVLQESFGESHSASQIAGSDHPHSSLSVLQRFLQQLLSAWDRGQSDDYNQQEKRRTVPLVKDGGYVSFILPRAFDPKLILQYMSSSQWVSSNRNGDNNPLPLMSLSDVVTGALEGSYELVLHRRHSLAGMCNTSDKVPLSDMVYLREFVHSEYRDRVKKELTAFYHTHQAIDLLVFRKMPTKSSTSTDEKANISRANNNSNNKNGEDHITYDESFECMEYIPADGPPLHHHWTKMTPSYSYLEDEFFGTNSESTGLNSYKRNFLAVGHSASPIVERFQKQGSGNGLSQANLQRVKQNMQNYRSLFAEELKERRGKKLRKMAFQSLEKQEWYIDEKLVKTEGAKIDLLNELSRFDLQDWD